MVLKSVLSNSSISKVSQQSTYSEMEVGDFKKSTLQFSLLINRFVSSNILFPCVKDEKMVIHQKLQKRTYVHVEKGVAHKDAVCEVSALNIWSIFESINWIWWADSSPQWNWIINLCRKQNENLDADHKVFLLIQRGQSAFPFSLDAEDILLIDYNPKLPNRYRRVTARSYCRAPWFNQQENHSVIAMAKINKSHFNLLAHPFYSLPPISFCFKIYPSY